jgi:tetratricopeptide (TPR) repeat protein
MKRARVAVAGAGAETAAPALLLGGVLREPSPAVARTVAPISATPVLSPRVGVRDTAARIRAFQTQVRADPSDARTLTLLGLAYQQRTRETSDPSYLGKSDGVIRRALRLAPRSGDATIALAQLALARHDFRDALRLARRARLLAPRDARTDAVLGDALVELGRYQEAFDAYDRIAIRKPGAASYARVSYARELLGRPRDAIKAMELALAASTGQPEALAWAHVELGKLHFSLGELEPAVRHLHGALAVFPGYVYAYEPLARMEAARGRDGAAIALAMRAVDAVPLPQFVATLADLYRFTGRTALARRQYALIGAVRRLLAANGVKTDLETALFDVDHGLRLPQALATARRAHRARPSVEADDVLAWALARTGRCGEALRFSKRALRLGTRDAPKFFHRGMIERCLGDHDEARRWFRRALDLNPHFSLLWADTARRYAQ